MIFATGLSEPEGPVALPDGSWLLVESGEGRGSVTHLSADGKTRRSIQSTPRPNGLAVDNVGGIWLAESRMRALMWLTMEGKAEVVATACDGEDFLFPNDLCFGPDGAIYMTDSGVRVEELVPDGRIRPDYLTLPYDGRVYRIDTRSGHVRQLDRGFRITNGIAFGADQNLYISETVTGNIYRYECKNGAVTGLRSLFGNVIAPDAPAGWKGPDGMAFGADGRLYVAVLEQRGLTVLDSDGTVIDRIATAGRAPTNVAFALHGRKMLVTEIELGQLEMLDAPAGGLPLWTGPA